jgi:hypothetical protein
MANDNAVKTLETSKKIVLSAERRCYFCKETRRLHKAHIIPSHIFLGVEYEGEGVPQLNHTVYMCPTHHYCYDHYELSDKELQLFKPVIDRYVDIFTRLLKCIEVQYNPDAILFNRKLAYTLDRSWRWWRHYGIR